MKCVLVYFLFVAVFSAGPTVSVLATDPAQEPVLCPEGPEGITCLGSNIAKNLVGQLFGASVEGFDVSPRHLLDGFQLVHVANGSSESLDEEGHEGRDISDKLFRNVRKLISNYELRVRLSELLNGVLTDVSESQGRKGGLGGGKIGKKGGGLMLAMMMMGGMMKMMAMGALAMLAMKALTVSSLAFMLSLIVGLKKLLSKKDDDDGGHVVQVVGSGHSDHHRRAFVVDNTASHQLAYRGQQRK